MKREILGANRESRRSPEESDVVQLGSLRWMCFMPIRRFSMTVSSRLARKPVGFCLELMLVSFALQ